MKQCAAASSAILIVTALTISGCGSNSPDRPEPTSAPNPAPASCVLHTYGTVSILAADGISAKYYNPVHNISQGKIGTSISWDDESPTSSCCKSLQSMPTAGGAPNSSWRKDFCSACQHSENFAVKTMLAGCGHNTVSGILSSSFLSHATQPISPVKSKIFAERTFLANAPRNDTLTCNITRKRVKDVRIWNCSVQISGVSQEVFSETFLPGMTETFSIPEASSACCAAAQALMHAQWGCAGECCGPDEWGRHDRFDAWCSSCAGSPAFNTNINICKHRTLISESTAVV